VVPGDAVLTEHKGLFVKRFVISDNHTSFSSGDVLNWVETEGAEVGELTNVLALVRGTEGVRTVSDDLNVMLLGDGVDGLIFTWLTTHVDGDNALQVTEKSVRQG